MNLLKPDIDVELFTDEELDFLERINIKLVTRDGMGSQFVVPKAVELEDDETITLKVEAWV